MAMVMVVGVVNSELPRRMVVAWLRFPQNALNTTLSCRTLDKLESSLIAGDDSAWSQSKCAPAFAGVDREPGLGFRGDAQPAWGVPAHAAPRGARGGVGGGAVVGARAALTRLQPNARAERVHEHREVQDPHREGACAPSPGGGGEYPISGCIPGGDPTKRGRPEGRRGQGLEDPPEHLRPLLGCLRFSLFWLSYVVLDDTQTGRSAQRVFGGFLRYIMKGSIICKVKVGSNLVHLGTKWEQSRPLDLHKFSHAE